MNEPRQAHPERAAAAPREWALSMALLVGSLALGCGSRESKPVSSPPGRAFVASAKGRIDIEGGVVRLAARRDGVIAQVLVEDGARVMAGQVLATLEDTLAQRNLGLAMSEREKTRRQLEPTRIRLRAAEREVLRQTSLASNGIISRQELDRARDDRDLVQADLAALQQALVVAERQVAVSAREIDERLVRAPLNGQIIQRQARPGNGVSIQNITPLFLFAPDTPRIVRVELEERFLGLVQLGQEAEIILEAAPDQRRMGRLLRVGKVVGQRTPSDDPADRQDNRIVECVVSTDSAFLIGQRVIVRFLPFAEARPGSDSDKVGSAP